MSISVLRAPALVLACAALAGCGVASVVGATAGAAISVTGAVVSTGVTLTGKAIGAGIDAVSPSRPAPPPPAANPTPQ